MGCGGGSLLRLMRAYGNQSWKLAGWDFPGSHLERLANDGFEVLSAPIDVSHAPTGIADVVILNQVIEHFARPDEIARIAKQLLGPEGVLFIETPDVAGIDARLFKRRHWGGYHFPRHLVLFSAASLRRLIEAAGFEVVAVEHLTSPSFWVQSFHHWLAETPARPLARIFDVTNPVALAAATALDLATARLHPTSNVRIVARKALASSVVA